MKTKLNSMILMTGQLKRSSKKKQQLIKQMLSCDSQNSAMNFSKQMSKTSDYISLYSDIKKQVETERATN